jgi:hypothetical protein
VLVIGNLGDGRRGDMVQVFAVNRCISDPMIQIQFPGSHFSYKDYEKNPVIQDFSWDGQALFVFHSNIRNDGFGELHIFNMKTAKPILGLNPLGGCCYRDPQWSPDGAYLLFAFQDMKSAQSTTKIYYIQYGSIGAGEIYKPLPLPDITDPIEKPSPVLRPAMSP